MVKPEQIDATFEPTYTIMTESVVFGMPEVLQDEAHGLWSFKRARGGKRVVLTYDDIEACSVVEKGADASAPRPEGAKGILSVLANPGAVSRDNAARSGKVCMGLSVEVVLRPPLATTLELPIWQRPVRRSERLYREVREQADAIKARFDGMIASAGAKSSGGAHGQAH